MSMDTSHSVCLNVDWLIFLPICQYGTSDLEEAMFETGKSLSAISKFDSVLEKNQPILRKINQSTNLIIFKHTT